MPTLVRAVSIAATLLVAGPPAALAQDPTQLRAEAQRDLERGRREDRCNSQVHGVSELLRVLRRERPGIVATTLTERLTTTHADLRTCLDAAPAGTGQSGGLGSLRAEGGTDARAEGVRVVESVLRGRVSSDARQLRTESGDEVAQAAARQIVGAVRASAMRRCYETSLRRDANGSGRMVVTLRIESDGRIVPLRVLENRVSDWQLGECVLGVLSRVRVAEASASVRGRVISYPIQFQPQNDEPVVRPAFFAIDVADRGTPDYEVHGAVEAVARGRILGAMPNWMLSQTPLTAEQCYAAAVARNRNLRGEMDVELTVAPAGAVSSVRITRDQLGDGSVATCVQRGLAGLRVNPAPVGSPRAYRFRIVFGG